MPYPGYELKPQHRKFSQRVPLSLFWQMFYFLISLISQIEGEIWILSRILRLRSTTKITTTTITITTTTTTTTTSKPADDDVISEIRFVLKDSSQLQTLFDNMSDCQALNEDQARDAMEEEAEYEEEEDYGEEEEEEEYEDEAVGIIDGEAVVDYSAFCPADDDMTPQGLATLKRLEAALCNGVENSENGTAQFDDAEAEPEPMTA